MDPPIEPRLQPQQQPTQQVPQEDKEEMHRIQALCQIKCKKFACAIQQCLERNQYQEKPCWKEIAYWDVCCDRIKAREGQSSAASSSSSSSSSTPTSSSSSPAGMQAT